MAIGGIKELVDYIRCDAFRYIGCDKRGGLKNGFTHHKRRFAFRNERHAGSVSSGKRDFNKGNN